MVLLSCNLTEGTSHGSNQRNEGILFCKKFLDCLHLPHPRTLYNLFFDGLAGHIRDAVLFAKLPPTLDLVIQLPAHFESSLQENQPQLDTPVWAPSPVLVRAQHPAPALSKVRLKPCKHLRRLLCLMPRRSLRAGSPWSFGGSGPLQPTSCPGPLQTSLCPRPLQASSSPDLRLSSSPNFCLPAPTSACPPAPTSALYSRPDFCLSSRPCHALPVSGLPAPWLSPAPGPPAPQSSPAPGPPAPAPQPTPAHSKWVGQELNFPGWCGRRCKPAGWCGQHRKPAPSAS